MTDYKIDTILAHAGINNDEKTGALISPIHLSTTYQHPEFGHSTGFDYTRTKNPTRASLEATLAAIEKADHALATSSGMAALVLLFNGFPVGSQVVAARDLYGGSFRWFNEQESLGRFQFTYANSEVELIAAITDQTDYVYLETPTNPLMVEFDIAKVSAIAHAKGAKVIVDNPNFKLKLATHKKFTRRLVVQAFFRVIINPIFDKSDFFQSRFLGSFW